MLSLVIYLNTKLIFVKQIVIHKIFIQTIIHNTFKHFEKTGKIEIGRQCSIFLKTGITFEILGFSGKTLSSRDASRRCSAFCNFTFSFGDSLLTFHSLWIPIFEFDNGELDFLFCFPVISFITCDDRLVSYDQLFRKEAQQIFSFLIFSNRFLQFLHFFSDSVFQFFKNLNYSYCLDLEYSFSPIVQ